MFGREHLCKLWVQACGGLSPWKRLSAKHGTFRRDGPLAADSGVQKQARGSPV